MARDAVERTDDVLDRIDRTLDVDPEVGPLGFLDVGLQRPSASMFFGTLDPVRDGSVVWMLGYTGFGDTGGPGSEEEIAWYARWLDDVRWLDEREGGPHRTRDLPTVSLPSPASIGITPEGFGGDTFSVLAEDMRETMMAIWERVQEELEASMRAFEEAIGESPPTTMHGPIVPGDRLEWNSEPLSLRSALRIPPLTPPNLPIPDVTMPHPRFRRTP